MRFTPLRITLIYFFFALLWITTTDNLVEFFVNDVAFLTLIQTIKGFFYITVTAIALYWMVKSHEKSINQKQELQNEIFSAMPAMITIYDPDLSEFTVNKKFEKTTGWLNSELSADNIMYLAYPDDEYRKEVQEFMQNPNGKWKDFEIATKSGERIQTTWTNVRLSNETQIGIGFDISDRKEIEDKLKKNEEWLQLTTTSAGVGLWEWKPKTGEIIIDHMWAELIGYTYEELQPVDIETWNRLVHPEDLIEFNSQVKKYFNGEIPIYECEVRMKHKDGHWVWILDRGRIIEWDDDGDPYRLVGTHVDITDRKNIEQKVEAEKELFKVISNLVSDVIYDWDAVNDNVTWNNGINSTFGYEERDSGYDMSFWIDKIHPDDKERILKMADEVREGNDNIWIGEYRLVAANKDVKYVRDKAFIFRNEEGKIVRMIGAVIDLTEEQKANEFLRYHANLLSEMSDAVVSTDSDLNIKSWNRAAEEIYGWKESEVIGKPVIEILDTKFVDTTSDSVSEKLNNDGEWNGEVVQKTKTGQNRNILSSAKLLKNKNDEKTGIIIINRDITAHLQIDKEKRLFADLFLRSNTGLAVGNHQKNNLERVNETFASLFGYEMQEMVGMSTEKLYSEAGLQELQKEVGNLLKDGFTTFEAELIKKNGEIFIALINLALVKDQYGETEYRISTVQDISQIKKQQVELKKSRDRLLEAQKIARLGYWSFDLESNEFEWSDIVYEIYDLNPETFKPNLKNYIALVHPDDADIFKAAVRKNDQNGFKLVHRILRENEVTGYVQIRGELRFDDDLNKEILSGTVLDITETKKIEKRLEQEQKRFEIAAEITSDVVWEWNPDVGQLWWGEGMETVLGYKKEDYEGDIRFWQKKIADKDRERVVNSMESAENSSDTFWSDEYVFIAADGTEREIKDSAAILRNKDGSINRIIGAMVDKTKETEFQNALREQGHKFEMIAKSSNDVLYDRNLRTHEVWWSEGWQTRFDYKEDEIGFTSEWWENNLHPDDRERIISKINEAASLQKNSWSEYYKFKNGNGKYSIVIDKGYFIKDADGKNYSLVGTISDMTADIRAKEDLKASEEQYRLLFEQSPLPMYIYDPESLLFITANNSCIEKYGYSNDELMGMKIFELHPESHHNDVIKEIHVNLKQKRTGFDTWQQVTKTGEKIIAEISGTEIFYEGRILRLVVANDITEQKKAEERAISAIVEGEERERQRIAKELHDGLGQYLSASNMNLTSVFEDLENMPVHLSDAFKTGLNFLNHAISETRNISQNLLPKAIQDYGLELAAESLVNHLSQNTHIKFYFYKNLDNIEIPDKIQINLYRILQESLNNAIRHGKPKKIDVQLVYSCDEILMTIEDNGIGFDPNKLKDEGIGIRSMKTRVGAMSANIDIVSTKGRGTIISVVVPV